MIRYTLVGPKRRGPLGGRSIAELLNKIKSRTPKQNRQLNKGWTEQIKQTRTSDAGGEIGGEAQVNAADPSAQISQTNAIIPRGMRARWGCLVQFCYLELVSVPFFHPICISNHHVMSLKMRNFKKKRSPKLDKLTITQNSTYSVLFHWHLLLWLNWKSNEKHRKMWILQ